MATFIEQPRYSCALGTTQTVAAIKRATPILHSGPGCGTKINSIIGLVKGYGGANSMPCTNSSESEIVFGGEEKLRRVIQGALKVMDADLFVVLTGCTSDIVGDDTGSITREFQEQGLPLVFCETGGFKSNNYLSHDRVVNAIIDQYVDRYARDSHTKQELVNVFVSPPYQDPFWEGNLEELKRILAGIGLKANVLFGTASEGLAEWLTIPNARFNIVASSWCGLAIAEHLREKYNIPYFHFPYLPVGGNETSRFLRQVGEFAGLAKDRVETYIQKEETRFYTHFERLAEFILEFKYGIPRRFYSILDASSALGFARYLLNELGIIPVRQYIIDNTPEEAQERIRREFEKISDHRAVEVSFEIDGGRIHQEIRQDEHKTRTLLIGSSWESQLARDIGADLLVAGVPITYRVVLGCGYAGYNGGLRLLEDIYDRVLETYR
jgi:nitrogenase molybdenum-iron protein beta chain